ncbi:DUF6048 family protein [Flavobacterium sp.]|uniref:DUF6048 family protein n=1 Tax=Flavobacterium sp. TaxID=239 RepID=UPI003526CE8B
MKFILKYIFSFFLIGFTIFGNAQEDSTKVSFPQRYGLRVGLDLHRLSKSFYDNNYKGLEIVADYRLTKKYFIAGELGNEEKNVDDDRLNFTTKGSYFKVGFDYNAFENWLDMENMIYAGMRVGFSSFSHELNSYKIYDPTNYYGETIFSTGQKFNSLNASWLELVGGIKAEIFNNVFLGFSVKVNYLLSDKKPDNFDNLFIPGYNRTYDGKFGAGFNYSISYFIPIYKKDK